MRATGGGTTCIGGRSGQAASAISKQPSGGRSSGVRVLRARRVQPSQRRWLLGTVVLLANWPYTIFAIMPTNQRLMNTPAGAATAETRRMIGRWGILHAGRSALGLIATLVFLWAEQ